MADTLDYGECTPRMMREMAKQMRELVAQRSTPTTRRMRELPNQLEQEAAAIEAEIVGRLSYSSRTRAAASPF